MYTVNEKQIEKLSIVLKKLNEGVTEDTRREALKIVSNIDPIELSIAEQRLIEQGMNPQELRNLCDIHMEVLSDELVKLQKKIEPGHLLDTFIIEHEKIKGFLTELEKRNITGQTRIMRMEHDDLRERKSLLKETARNAETMDFNQCKSKIDELAKYIVFNLRDHIYKVKIYKLY